MDSGVLSSLISGLCSIASALGAVYLKDRLERQRSAGEGDVAGAPAPAPRERAPRERPQPEAPPRRSAALEWHRPLLIVAGSLGLGMATRAVRPWAEFGHTHYEMLVAFALLFAAVVVLVLQHRQRGRQSVFQLENLALWAGFASGWSLVHGGVWSDLLAVTVPWWLACAVVGGVALAFLKRRGGR